MVQLTYTIIGSDDNVAQNKWQAIIWTNYVVGEAYIHHSASMS